MLDPLERVADLQSLIDRESYFVIHAPRQSGKTTLLQELAKTLTRDGKYAALRVSCEVGQPFRDDFAGSEKAIVQEMINEAKISLSVELQPPQNVPHSPPGVLLKTYLEMWSTLCPKPLVLLFDEIDALTDASLESVLRQLRAGFNNRPAAFPQSIVLCGLRDVRDYKIASGGSPRLGTASPFNVKVESLRLGNFTSAEVTALYLQHSAETGQKFTDEALSKAYESTGGQPWLTNALAREVIEKMKVPHSESITQSHIEEAAQRLIIARATHLDSLAAKLNEERVRKILSPVLEGTLVTGDATYNDDLLYVRDLGLVKSQDPLEIANPIYREVILRVLAGVTTPSIVFDRPSFVTEQGSLDMNAILSEFAIWWKRHAAVMLKGHVYHEVAAQIVFMAWLQRVVNGGGMIDREYGIGRGRIDILVRWPLPNAQSTAHWQQEAIELKAWADAQSDPLQEGLEQLERYLDGLHLNEGTLVIFDRRSQAKSSVERTLLAETQTKKGYRVRLLRA